MNECPCSRPSEGFLCRACIATLRKGLDKIAEYWPESEVTLARQHVMPSNGGGNKIKGGAKGDGLPFHYGAARVRYEVEAGITTWLRDVAGDRIPDEVGTLEQACQWMSTYATMIGNLPQGLQVLDDVDRWHHQLERLIDRPRDRVIVAHCDVCGKGLAEEPGALSAVCEDCEVVVQVEPQQSSRIRGSLGKYVTKDVAVTAVAYFCRHRITTKTIARWVRNREVKEHDGLVLVADVVAKTQEILAKRGVSDANCEVAV